MSSRRQGKIVTLSKKKTSKTTESSWLSLLFQVVIALAFLGEIMLVITSRLWYPASDFFSAPTSLLDLLFDPVALFIGEVILVPLAVLLGTASMREQMQIKRRKLLNKVQAQQSVGMEVSVEELSAAQTTIPTFHELLRRNSIISLFFVPLTLLPSFVSVTAVNLLLDAPGKVSQIAVYVVVGVSIYGWVFIVGRGWRIVARIVDQRLQVKHADDPTQEISLALPQPITTPSVRSSLAQPQPIPETVEAMSTKLRSERNAPETSVYRNVFILFLALTGCGVAIGLGFAQAGRNTGASADTIKLLFAIPLGLSELLLVVGGRWMIKLFPKEHWLLFGLRSVAPLRRGEYEAVLAQADRMVEERPNWMTRFTAAAAFAEAGRFEKAEQLLRTSLRNLAEKVSAQDDQSEYYRNSMLMVRGMLIDVLAKAGEIDQAVMEVSKLPSFKKPNPVVERTLAKVHMYRGQIDLAQPHLNIAKQLEARQSPKGYKTALYAWAAALQGDSARADDLITQAFKQVPPQNVAGIAEVQLYAAYVARAERNSMAARDAFRKAIELNPDGAYGRIARRELDRVDKAL